MTTTAAMEGNGNIKQRATRVTGRQLSFLVDYMLAHKDFATGRLLSSLGRKANNKQWIKLAEQLNKLPGPSKNITEWKKCWTDYRGNVRHRAAKARAARTTVGNAVSPTDLTEMDQKVLSILISDSCVRELDVGGTAQGEENISQLLGIAAHDEAKEIQGIVILDSYTSLESTTDPSDSSNISQDPLSSANLPLIFSEPHTSNGNIIHVISPPSNHSIPVSPPQPSLRISELISLKASDNSQSPSTSATTSVPFRDPSQAANQTPTTVHPMKAALEFLKEKKDKDSVVMNEILKSVNRLADGVDRLNDSVSRLAAGVEKFIEK